MRPTHCLALLALGVSLSIVFTPVDGTFMLMKELHAYLPKPARPSGCPLSLFNSNAEPGLEGLPESLRDVVAGRDVTGDSGVSPDEPPAWLDRDKYLRGQAFARENLFSIVTSNVLSLFLTFLFPGELEPLIFTGRSDTPYKSFQRYLDTATRVNNWYESDLWTPGTVAYKTISIVRGYHLEARMRLAKATPETLRFNTSMDSWTDVWSTSAERLCEDFVKSSCPIHIDLMDEDITNRVHLNQMDMSLTQFAFVGLIVTFPEQWGVHPENGDVVAMERGLDAFTHLWEAIGYALGIEDRYNFCRGGLEATRQRTRDVVEYLVKPRLRTVDRRWEHMTRVLFEGLSYYVPGITFETNLLYVLNTIGVPAPRLVASLSPLQRLIFKYANYFSKQVTKVRGVPIWASNLVRQGMKAANNAPPQWHESLKRRTYRYQFLPKPQPFQCRRR